MAKGSGSQLWARIVVIFFQVVAVLSVVALAVGRALGML
jgi:hypothetical protein